MLFPPLAWLLSPQLVAALASVGTAAAFEALAHDVYGDDAWLGATWLGAATVTELLSGRLTFAFGLCGAALTALLLERRRPRWAAVVACVTALASPVAGLFAALAGTVASAGPARHVSGPISLRYRRGIGCDRAFGGLARSPSRRAATSRSPSGPCGRCWWPAALRADAPPGRLHRAPPRSSCTSRAAWPPTRSHTPVGGNAARLGRARRGAAGGAAAGAAARLAAAGAGGRAVDLPPGPRLRSPICEHGVAGEHGRLLPAADPLPGDAAGARDLARRGPVHRGPLGELTGWRREVPLARGWERQTDIADNGLFYDGRLTASTLRRVAASARRALRRGRRCARRTTPRAAELALIRRGLPYLRRGCAAARTGRSTRSPIRPRSPRGAGRLRVDGPELTDAWRWRIPGCVHVRVRWSPYWQLSGVRGCVAP